jgi:hypothetical protein
MELFIPSALLLLLAAAVIFFVLPRFGAPVLALISLGLLIYGVREHMNAFGTEYRFSTWQLGLISYAPYVMVGGLLFVIAFYLLSMSPFGKAGTTAAVEMPTVAEMPKAETATNTVTAGVNNALKGAKNALGNAAAAVGLGNAAKAANNKGAGNEIAKKANEAATGVANSLKSALSSLTGNNKKGNNNNNNNNNNNSGGNNTSRSRVPGLNFPLSQV